MNWKDFKKQFLTDLERQEFILQMPKGLDLEFTELVNLL